MNSQVKIYEIKSNQTARDNFHTLWKRDENAFYWNESNFTKNEEGDVIFVVNRHDSWALYCTIETFGIPTEYHAAEELTTFNHNYNTYRVKGEWQSFLRMRVEQTVKIHRDWNWTRQLGQSETYILWEGEKTKTREKRLEKVADLKKVFVEGEALGILNQVEASLLGTAWEKEDQPQHKQKQIWFVCQGSSYLQRGTQFLWAPKKGKDGGGKYYWDNMLKVKEGDFIFHYSTRGVRGISKAISNPYDAPNPDTNSDRWNEEGIKIEVEHFDLDPIIDYKLLAEHRDEIVKAIGNDKGPIDKDGKVKQGYLFNFSKSAGTLLRQLHGEPFPEPFESYFLPKPADMSSIQGLIVSDPYPWKEDLIEALETDQYNHAIIWWNKMPSGGKDVLKALEQKIKQDHAFDFYVAERGQIAYRCRVRDFALDAESYDQKNWNGLNADVFEWKRSFADYADDAGRKARIVFLVDKIEPINEALTVSDIEYYQGQKPPVQNNLQAFTGFKEMDTEIVTNLAPKDIIEQVEKYIAGRGFYFSRSDISNFYLSLKTKPFVILAGISGTGKTQLARLFIEAIGYQANCEVIPVRPDWTDNSDLIGYTDLTGKFQSKPMVQLIQRAHDLPNEPFFLILDEMNLARVEYYFSDFLSVIESRKWEEGSNRIITDELVKQSFLGDATNKEVFSGLHIPDNVYIIGTVNMDETTHPFSRKVLDRANSIEMNQVDLNWRATPTEQLDALGEIYNDFLRSQYINSKDILEAERKDLGEFIQKLTKINALLEEADLQFAYRVRDEMAFYLLLNMANDLLPEKEALDFQLMQKVLPRIQGSSIGVKQVLLGLMNILEGIKIAEQDYSPDNLRSQLPDEGKAQYPRSLRKIGFMLRRYHNDGFTSFWQ